MKPDDKRFVPYAVELGCTVSVDDTSEQGPVRKVVVTRGVLSAEFYTFRRTRYTVRNKAKQARTLYVEHPRTGWQLQEGQEPAETNLGTPPPGKGRAVATWVAVYSLPHSSGLWPTRALGGTQRRCRFAVHA